MPQKTKRKPGRKYSKKNETNINGWANLILIIIVTVGMVSFIIAGDNRNEHRIDYQQQCIEKIYDECAEMKADLKLLIHKVDQYMNDK